MRFRSVSIAFIGTVLFLWVPAASAQKRVFARVVPNTDTINGNADIFDPSTGSITPAVGKMAKARESHVALTLNTGMVLLAGGYNDDYLNTAELYDPAADTFTAVGNMTSARFGAAAVLLQDGTAYIVGGYNGTYLSSADIYDPSKQTFSTSSAYLLNARENATATLLSDGKVLIAGGYGVASSTSANGYLNEVEMFDPVAKTMTTASTMNSARVGHSATLLPDGKVLIAGGCSSSETGINTCDQYVGVAEIYDPSTGAWTQTGTMKTPRIGHTASLLSDGTVLIAGGTDQNKAPVAAAEIYDPASGQFTQTGSLATPRTNHTATTLQDGRILIAGGYSDHYLSSLEIYDPHSKTFTAVSAPMSEERSQLSAAALPDGRVLLAGGQNSDLLLFTINYQETSNNVAPDVAFSSDSKIGFVPYAGSGVVLAFSTQTGAVIKRIMTGGKPEFLTVLPDGRTLAAVSVYDNRIFLIGMDSLSLQGTYTFNNSGFAFGSRLTVFPGTNTGYISSTSTGEVIKFNLLNGQELGRLENVMTPAQITLTKNGSTLMVVDTTNNEIDFADTSTMTAKYKMKPSTTDYPYVSFSIFNKPVLNQDGSYGVIGSQDTSGTAGSAFIFNPSTGDVVSRQIIGTTPGYTTLFPDGDYWLILSLDKVSIVPTSPDFTAINFDLASGTPPSSANILVTPDSVYAYYAASDNVYEHDLAHDAVVGRFLVGDNPNVSNDQASVLAMTPDGLTMAVVDAASNELDLLADCTIQRQTKFLAQLGNLSGLTLVNLSSSPANISIAAISDGGGYLTVNTDLVTNPESLQLGPNAQSSIDVSQLFALDPTQNNTAHLEITSDQPAIAGYSILGQIRSAYPNFYLSNVEPFVLFPDYRKRLYDFIIPEIPQATGTSVEMNFVNPNYNTCNYDVTHYATDGTSIEQKTGNSVSGSTRSTGNVSDLVTTSHAGQVVIVGGSSSTSAAATNATAEFFDLASSTFSSTTGAPATPRQGHSSTMLPNEKILLAGGKNNSGILNSAEIYDPVAGTFSPTTGTMNQERNQHTATSLLSGKVLIAAGQSSSSINNTAELFDPIANTFSLIPVLMNSPRYAHTATFLADGTVLLAGGIDGVSVSSTAEIYDPVSSSFKSVGNMTIGRAFHTAVLLPNGKVLIAGGYNGKYLASAEIYDPSTGLFSPAQSMTTQRSNHTCTLLENGTVLITGGTNNSGVLNTAETYNPASGKFAPAGNMTSARTSHTATLLSDTNHTVLITGGTDGTNVLDTAETYNPTTGVFTATSGMMTTARQGHSATLLYGADQGYLRVTSMAGLLFTEIYNPACAINHINACDVTPFSGGASTAINGIDVNKFVGVTSIYSPEFAIVPQSFDTYVNIINANQDSQATVNLTVHAPNGQVLAGPAAFVLPPNAQVKGELLTIFQNYPALQNQTGWLEINSSVDRVVGTVTLTNSANSFLTSFEMSGVALTDFVFPLVSEDSTYDTGVTLLNTGNQAAHVVVELWGTAGTRDAAASITIAPHTQVSQPLSGLLPGMQPHTTANLRVHSDQPLHGNAYFYDRAMHFVSTVPPVSYPGR